MKLPRGWAGPVHSDAGHRDCVLIGTAAGLAAAFSTPLGGLLLAIEQGSSFLTISLFWRGFLATCTCTVVLHMLAFTKVLIVNIKLMWLIFPYAPYEMRKSQFYINIHIYELIGTGKKAESKSFVMQAAPVSAWEMKLGIRRELGLYADSIANYGAWYSLIDRE